MATQPSLFFPRKETLEEIPYSSSYRYSCGGGCGGHEQMIIDWEIAQAFRTWRYDEPERLEKIREHWLGKLCGPGRDTFLFAGNQHQHPGSFLVLGVFWPPKRGGHGRGEPFHLVRLPRGGGAARPGGVPLRGLLVGLVRSWTPPRRKARSLDEGREIEDAVLAKVAGVIRLFGARAITDQCRSAGVAERLRRYGISVRAEPMTAPTKDAAFGFLRGRINEGSIELYEQSELARELRAIRTRYAAGRSSVVTPRIGGGQCDLAQALTIAVFEHDRRGLGTGEYVTSAGLNVEYIDQDELPLPFGHPL